MNPIFSLPAVFNLNGLGREHVLTSCKGFLWVGGEGTPKGRGQARIQFFSVFSQKEKGGWGYWVHFFFKAVLDTYLNVCVFGFCFVFLGFFKLPVMYPLG